MIRPAMIRAASSATATEAATPYQASAWWRLPWVVQVLLLFAVARLVSTVVLVLVAQHQGPSPWAGGSPGYFVFLTFWDSGWYERIFHQGYPTELPRDRLGVVEQNQWAFYGLFPGLVWLLNAVTGIGWLVLAPVVATVCGFAAAPVIYRLFRLRASHGHALWAVALTAFLPVAPILQIPYAESLHLLLLATALYLVATGRFLAAVPVVVLMSLARPAGVPFAIMMGLLWVVALWRRRTSAAADREPFGRLTALTAVSAIAALAWPALAWAATGEMGAYVATEMAWRGQPLSPFSPWYWAAYALVGPWWAPVAVIGLLALVIAVFRSSAVRRIGPVLWFWCVSYVGYLAAFWDPHSSTLRILLPLFPLLLAVSFAVRRRALRWSLLTLMVPLQVLWVAWFWAWDPSTAIGIDPP